MIRVNQLRYAVGSFRLDVSLEIADEEYFVLFGMTGCGKTSLLECLCGLRAPSAGSIELGGADVTRADPRTRRIGYVPQDGALFPHLSVSGNIAFSLGVAGARAAERRAQAAETARQLGIEHLLDRSLTGLSGGERQRVALGRALVSRPQALLLDEPVCALDPFTRSTVCRLLVDVQRRVRIPVMHVCHLFEEATLVADRVGVMREGRLVQVGTPAQLLSAPRDAYVARLIGLPNILTGRWAVREAQPGIECAGLFLRVPALQGAVGDPADFMIPPWKIHVAAEAPGADPQTFRGRVRHAAQQGPLTTVLIEGTPVPLLVHLPSEPEGRGLPRPGTDVRLAVPPEAVHVLPA